MGWEAILTVAVIAGVVFGLVRNLAGPDLVLGAGLVVVLTAGVVTPAEAFSGFASEGVLAVAALLVVAAGVRETGGLDVLADRLLGRPKSLGMAELRMMAPVAALSAFMGNTAVVAMGVSIVQDWSKRLGRPPSRFLLPLSYAAILGGMCTLVGTSTNLVVFGLYQRMVPDVQMGLFDIAILGGPVLVVGFVYMLAVSPWMPPSRDVDEPALTNPREYAVMMRVEPGSTVAGKSVEQAGLRHLPGLFLSEIQRGGSGIAAPGPQTVIEEGDHLVFVGIVDSVKDLSRIPGLVPAVDHVERLAEPRPERCLVEAVVSGSSGLVGSTVRDAAFRTTFNAAIIAVHRHGERIEKKIGDIVLEAGDALLMEAHPTWAGTYRYDGNFLLVSEVEGSRRPRRDKATWALVLLGAMVGVVALGWLSLLNAALLTIGGMLLARCLTGSEARAALDVRLILAIASAFGIGVAVDRSGLAALLAGLLADVAGGLGPVALLASVYLLTAILTEIVTNAAAAALVFPVAMAAAGSAELPLTPFVFVVMIAASASFSTPIGYQTNLMVYGPGGYRFGDYVRYGLPLQLLVASVSVGVAAGMWF